ncbi:MAG: helix-turn-helix transcriptional regulator [Phreatobacter sp.]|nr:helix-turn-helix transcriptional regulator [Phreatobacter sp.]
MDIVGDRWTLLIVRDLMWHGKHTFGAIQNSAERVPTNILADRLKRLEEWGLVRREAYQERPIRYGYDLTEAGRSLEPLLLEIMAWGHDRLGGGRYDPTTGKSWDAEG